MLEAQLTALRHSYCTLNSDVRMIHFIYHMDLNKGEAWRKKLNISFVSELCLQQVVLLQTGCVTFCSTPASLENLIWSYVKLYCRTTEWFLLGLKQKIVCFLFLWFMPRCTERSKFLFDWFRKNKNHETNIACHAWRMFEKHPVFHTGK